MNPIDVYLLKIFLGYIGNFDFSKIIHEYVVDKRDNVNRLCFTDEHNIISGAFKLHDDYTIGECSIKFRYFLGSMEYTLSVDFHHNASIKDNLSIQFMSGRVFVGGFTLYFSHFNLHLENDAIEQSEEDIANTVISFVNKVISCTSTNKNVVKPKEFAQNVSDCTIFT